MPKSQKNDFLRIGSKTSNFVAQPLKILGWFTALLLTGMALFFLTHWTILIFPLDFPRFEITLSLLGIRVLRNLILTISRSSSPLLLLCIVLSTIMIHGKRSLQKSFLGILSLYLLFLLLENILFWIPDLGIFFGINLNPWGWDLGTLLYRVLSHLQPGSLILIIFYSHRLTKKEAEHPLFLKPILSPGYIYWAVYLLLVFSRVLLVMAQAIFEFAPSPLAHSFFRHPEPWFLFLRWLAFYLFSVLLPALIISLAQDWEPSRK